MNSYLFKSERLGFRNWQASDIPKMAEINADPEVMEFFPSTQTLEHTAALIKRMQKLFEEKGFCFFAAEELKTSTFIGFIGLSEATYEASFTPCVEIGWRLSKKAWGKGYATEGAKRCLKYGFNELKLQNIKSICPTINVKSERVMVKIGMTKELIFKHPKLSNHKEMEKCFLYTIDAK